LVLGVLGLFHRLVPDVVGLVGLVGFHLGKHDLVVLLEHALDVGEKGLALFAHFALLGFLDVFALFILGRLGRLLCLLREQRRAERQRKQHGQQSTHDRSLLAPLM